MTDSRLHDLLESVVTRYGMGQRYRALELLEKEKEVWIGEGRGQERDWIREQKRQEAQYGGGTVCFETKDGGRFQVKEPASFLALRVIKRPCREKSFCTIEEADHAYHSITTRNYERTSEYLSDGTPIYREI